MLETFFFSRETAPVAGAEQAIIKLKGLYFL